jgi:hypothetical protein
MNWLHRFCISTFISSQVLTTLIACCYKYISRYGAASASTQTPDHTSIHNQALVFFGCIVIWTIKHLVRHQRQTLMPAESNKDFALFTIKMRVTCSDQFWRCSARRRCRRSIAVEILKAFRTCAWGMRSPGRAPQRNLRTQTVIHERLKRRNVVSSMV